jgi:hypothetical protein
MEVENNDFFTANSTDITNCENSTCFIDMDIDNLVDAFNHKTTVVWKPKLNFVNDINVIIEELKQYHTFTGLDIYEVLVSCGHNLTWDQEYYVSTQDLNWFKHDEGKKHFFSSINEKNIINTLEEYRALMDIHFKLVELFELQLENL